MGYEKYLDSVMYRLSNIVFNGSQSSYCSKEEIIDALYNIVDEYQKATGKNFSLYKFRQQKV
jgi:uncharacterized protein Yka (UPF0111/DUF47 family)